MFEVEDGPDPTSSASPLDRFLRLDTSEALERRHHVTALLVGSEDSPLLTRALTAISAQTRPVDQAAGVDPEIVPAADAGAGGRTAFTAALRIAVSRVPAPSRPGGRRSATWYWILHDDVAPEPGCLEALLTGADSHGDAAILIPKSVGWADRQRLVSVGHRWAPGTPLVEPLDPGERDQGQYDRERSVYAGDSAGMLIRADVLSTLGGFDPEIGDWASAADLCRRAWGSGHAVMFIPNAVVAHRRAHRIISGDRPSTTPEHLPSARRLAREGQVLLAITATRRGPRSFGRGLSLLLSAVLRCLGLLLTREPEEAFAELAGSWDALRDRRRIRRIRARAWAPPVTDLRPPARVRATRGMVAGHAIESWWVGSGLSSWSWRRIAIPRGVRQPLLVAGALALLGILRNPSLLFLGGQVHGGGLLPATGTTDLLGAYLASWRDVRFGSAVAVPTYQAALALLGVPLLGSVDLLLRLMVVLSVPLAFLGARWWLAGHPRIPHPTALAVAYSCLPSGVAAAGAGRLSTLVVLLLGPPTARLVAGAVSGPAAGRIRPAVAAGSCLGLISVFAPLVLLVVSASAPLLVRRRPALRTLLGVLAVAASYAILWLPIVVADPDVLLREVGRNDPILLSAPTPLALSPGGPGAPAWAGACVLLAALLVVGWGAPAFPGAGRRRVQAGLLLAAASLAGLAWAPVDDHWLGLPLLAVGVALLLTIAAAMTPTAAVGVDRGPGADPDSRILDIRDRPGADRGGRVLEARDGGARLGRPTAARLLREPAGVIAGALAGTLVLGWWLAPGAVVSAGAASALPSVVASGGSDDGRSRALVLRREADGIHYAVSTGTGSRLGDAEVLAATPQDETFATVVLDLVAGSGPDPGPALRSRGIEFVVVSASAADPLVSRIEGVADLRRLATSPEQALWLVSGDPTRAALTDEEGTTTTVPVRSRPSSVDVDLHPQIRLPQTLTLAEAASSGWVAELAGSGLDLTTDANGTLVATVDQPGWLLVRHRSSWPYLAGAHLAALLALSVIALPKRRDADSFQEQV